jgi:hypothetical protein
MTSISFLRISSFKRLPPCPFRLPPTTHEATGACQGRPGLRDGRHALASSHDIEWDGGLRAADRRIGAGDWASFMHHQSRQGAGRG